MFTIRFLDFKIIYVKGTVAIDRDEFCWIPKLELLGSPEEIEEKKDKWLKALVVIPSGLICFGLIWFLTERLTSGGDYKGMYLLPLCAFPIITLYCVLLHFASYMGNSPLAQLRRKNRQMTKFLKMGVRPADLENALIDEWELRTGSDPAVYIYTYLQYFCALDKRDVERVYHLAHKMAVAVRGASILPYLDGICGELVFYFSYVEKNPEAAEFFKGRRACPIEKDMDLNGRRVYGYYLYGKGEEADKILKVIEEGLAVARQFSTPGNIPMEVGFLYYLRDIVSSEEEEEGENTETQGKNT